MTYQPIADPRRVLETRLATLHAELEPQQIYDPLRRGIAKLGEMAVAYRAGNHINPQDIAAYAMGLYWGSEIEIEPYEAADYALSTLGHDFAAAAGIERNVVDDLWQRAQVWSPRPDDIMPKVD